MGYCAPDVWPVGEVQHWRGWTSADDQGRVHPSADIAALSVGHLHTVHALHLLPGDLTTLPTVARASMLTQYR
jgi:hypothetical protein